MNSRPSLFDLGTSRPSTRDVADRVKSLGPAEGLATASQLADGAHYQEVVCRSALNKVEGMPFRWTLNPYRGCTHGCHYCFARRYHRQFELDAGDAFSSVILVKTNFVEVLRRELDRPSWARELVAFGTATDPYQPIEGHYKLTRRSLEALCNARTPVGLVTKGPMAVRDRDVLSDLGQRARCTVYFSVPTVDEDAWRALEPGTAHPLQRLRAVRALRDAGINAGVLMAPIVPGLTSQPSKLERTIKAIAEHGAAFMGTQVLYLKEGTRSHFLSYLAETFPHLVAKYHHLYAGAYPPKAYAREVRSVIQMLQDRHGIAARAAEGDRNPLTDPGPSEPDQRPFQWESGTGQRTFRG